jgi:hypothetical protein
VIIDPTPPFVAHNATACLVAYLLSHYVRPRWVVVGLALGIAFALSIFWVIACPELGMVWRDFVSDTVLKLVSRPWEIDGEAIFGVLFGVILPAMAAYFVSFAFGARNESLPKLTIWKLSGVVASFGLIAWYLSRFGGEW